MEDKKMKGKLEEYNEEDLPTSDSSSDPTSFEDDSELEISDNDQQSLRNQQYKKITILGPDPKGKRPKYDDSSSSDTTLLDLNSPQNQPKQTSKTITLPILPKLDSWLQFQDLNKARTYALTGGISIPGVSSHSRPPKPPRPPRPPRPPKPPTGPSASKPSLELGLHQYAGTSASGSSSQTPSPNVGDKSEAAGSSSVSPSSVQQLRMQQSQFRPPSGALNLPSITPQSLHQLFPPPDYMTRMQNLENEVMNVKGVADLLLNELSNSNTRILKLEDEIRNLKKEGNQGLQKSSEKQTATYESTCGSGLVVEKVPYVKRIRSGPGSTSGKDDESQEPVTVAAGDRVSAANPADGKVPSDVRVRSGPGSTSGKDDESQEPVTIAAGVGASAANPADAKVPSDMRVRSGPGSTSGKDDDSQEPVTIAAGVGASAANPADAKVPSDIRVRSGPGSTSGKDDESQEPVTMAAGDGVSAANTDRNKATTESVGSQDEKKGDTTSQDEKKGHNTSQDEKKDVDTSQDGKKDANMSQDDNTQ